jgi:hypothetical protein
MALFILQNRDKNKKIKKVESSKYRSQRNVPYKTNRTITK